MNGTAEEQRFLEKMVVNDLQVVTYIIWDFFVFVCLCKCLNHCLFVDVVSTPLLSIKNVFGCRKTRLTLKCTLVHTFLFLRAYLFSISVFHSFGGGLKSLYHSKLITHMFTNNNNNNKRKQKQKKCDTKPSVFSD